MKTTHAEFMQSLRACQMIDDSSGMKCQQYLWQQYAFADDGVYYVPPDERGLPNLGDSILYNITQRELLRVDALFAALHSPGYWQPLENILH